MSVYKKYRNKKNNNNKNQTKTKSSLSTTTRPDSNLIGTVKKVGKNYVFVPRKLNRFYKSFDIDKNGSKPKRNTLYSAKVIQSPKKGIIVRLENEIGSAGSLDTERESLLHEYGMHEGFSEIVKKSVKHIKLSISERELNRRTDLRDKQIFTIDGQKARDYDDAVGIEKLKTGYKLWVCIADVSHYVKPSSELDLEAYRRATSVYLSKKVVPMLPERLSNNLCSLVPNEDRLTKTAEIVFNNDGTIKEYSVYRSVIKSKYRLTYNKVTEILNGDVRLDKKDAKLLKSLQHMEQLYKKVKKLRLDAGYIDLNIPEAQIVEDEDGNVVDVTKLKRESSHELIEFFMITANNVVASYINKTDSASIYRIHDSLKPDSMEELKDKLKGLGYNKKIKNKVKASEVQEILNYFKDTPKEYAANLFILRSMSRAIYGTKDTGHFGLALDYYTHFTSPIRRYPDLIIHRLLDSLIDKKEPIYDQKMLSTISSHCSEKETVSDEIERESMKLERAFVLQRYMGRTMKGIIISIQSFGLFVELIDIYAEGFVPRKKIRGFDESRFSIGQNVTVKISECDIDNRRAAFDLIKIHKH